MILLYFLKCVLTILETTENCADVNDSSYLLHYVRCVGERVPSSSSSIKATGFTIYWTVHKMPLTDHTLIKETVKPHPFVVVDCHHVVSTRICQLVKLTTSKKLKIPMASSESG